MRFDRIAIPGLALSAMLTAADAISGLYWEQGVRSKSISVCFVGDAVTSRPQRVQEVMKYIKEFEYAVNVRFSQVPISCPAPTSRSGGGDQFEGDIRVLLPFTSAPWNGPVPGVGCPMFRDAAGNYNGGNEGWGSWSNAPNDLPVNRACLYNLKLGDDGAGGVPYLNHALHEFGHALGMRHEHERNDVDRTLGCTEPNFGGDASSGFLTRYDRLSVMNYMFPSCGINGNYDYTGLSELDRLSFHILYPEDNLVAEFVGTTVVPNPHHIILQSAWAVRGADIGFTTTDFEWRVSGSVRSTSTVLDVQLAEGTYNLRFSHKDFLGRSYSYTGIIRVLPPEIYTRQTAAVSAAQLPLF